MPNRLMPYFLTFSRIAIGLIFATSSLGKIRTFSSFELAVEKFQILPRQLVKTSACISLGVEMAIVGLMILGRNLLLMTGFLMAILLLTVFCIALLTVLVRKLQVSCNCFGSSQKPVSLSDIWRNLSFLACAFMGVISLIELPNTMAKIKLGEIGLLGMMAVVFVVLSVHLGEIIQMLRIS